MKTFPMLSLCLLAICSVGAVAGADSPKHSSALPPRQQILDCLHRYTALDAFLTIETIDRVSLSEVNIPFLTPQMKDQTGIRVRFTPDKIKWDTSDGEFNDPKLRRFTVYLDAQARRVLSVTSQPVENSAVPYQPPSADSVAKQLRDASEIYTSFPPVDPKCTFMFALETARRFGGGNPIAAKEIDGFYIMDSRLGEKPCPVWVINMHGLPPSPIIGPYVPGMHQEGVSKKPYSSRALIDTTVGAWMMSSIGPEAEE